jgi:hypothetical protein
MVTLFNVVVATASLAALYPVWVLSRDRPKTVVSYLSPLVLSIAALTAATSSLVIVFADSQESWFRIIQIVSAAVLLTPFAVSPLVNDYRRSKSHRR